MNAEKDMHERQLIEKAYAAFNQRDIDTIVKIMHPEVKWSRAWEGDYANGPDDVRAYWQRQWVEIDPNVNPIAFGQTPDGRLKVTVDLMVKDLEGKVLSHGEVKHLYTFKNGLIAQMDIEQG